jgi:hypothetical protein
MTLSEKQLKPKRTGDVAQVADHLHSKHEAGSSNTSAAKKKKKNFYIIIIS